MTRKLSPWIGLLLFLGAALKAGAFDVPREVLIEVSRPVGITTDAAGPHSGLPDLDALVGQYQGAVMQYAIPASTARHADLKRYLLVRLDQAHERDLPGFIEKAAKLASVRWAQPNHYLRPNYLPNDPLLSSQWGLYTLHAPDAWNVTKGLAVVGQDTVRIPIAIIDTGCRMDHPDLVSSFWTNPGEIPGNGIDDDNNGFVDDVHGWDFVDAPSFPSGGDYLVRDNDPSDENGHGTVIAGIVAATMDNNQGVTGLAPACPLMILRAGNMDGYLQEDDVASALMYALDNGARVVNMSFGDTEASPMLEEVINFLGQGGVTMVAAAGNYGTEGIIYPAAFGPVLCVGAVNQSGVRASFSSYGTALDLMAPGTDVVSTLMDGGYGSGGSGTSFACAFASAAAGLVISRHPDWDPAMVMSVLKSSCDDLGDPGWDPQTGQGLLRVDRAVNVNDALVAQLTYPTMGQGFSQTDTLNINGTVSGVYLSQWWVLSGLGEDPVNWDTIRTAEAVQIVNDQLALWHNAQPADTAYTIRLKAVDMFGNSVDDRVVIYYDPSPPVISDISMVPILDGDRPSFLLRFHTDDLTSGKIWLQNTSNPDARWISLTLNYESQDHVLLIGGELDPELYNYRITVTNKSGLADSTGVLGSIDLRTASIATNNFVEQSPCNLPPGYLYETATDLNGNNLWEIWQDSLNANFGKESLYVYESAGGANFTSLGLNFGKQIPKSLGDSDADGKTELLTTYAGKSKIFEATAASPFPQPNNVVWSDSNDWWGVKLMDLVPGDGHGEVLLEHAGKYKLFANTGSGALNFLQDLSDPFSGVQTILQLFCQVNDYDNDGKKDLLFGDYGGHLFMYEQQDAGSETFTPTPVWTDSTNMLDVGQFLCEGDWDGDGQIEFACLAHTETVLPGEHLADTRYWTLFVFKHGTGDNQYVPMDTLYFFGARDPSEFASGISSGDVYGDSRPELILSLYPHLYVLGWDASTQGFQTLWYYPECRSNKVVVSDFNGDGHAEMLFSSGSQSRMFEAAGYSQFPPPPLNFKAQLLLSAMPPQPVHLTWSPVAGAQAYDVFRGTSPANLVPIGETAATDTTDYAVLLDTTYYYAVATVQLGVTGPRTVPVTVTPNTLPTIVPDSAIFTWPGFVELNFSEPMDNSILDPNNYYIYNAQIQLIQPRSIVSAEGGKRAVLSFDPVFEDGIQYRMIIDTLYDLQGSALVRSPQDTLRFTPQAMAQALPYLVSAWADPGRTHVTLAFSQPMVSLELNVKTNYSITADVASNLPHPDTVRIQDLAAAGDLKSVTLDIDPTTPLNSLIYRVEARNLHGQLSALPIDTTHNAATFSFHQVNLRDAFVAPNPYDPRFGQGYIKFENLTDQGEIRVLTVTGEVIRRINYSNGIALWNLDNDHGQKVGSGVYLYYIVSGSEKVWGKLAVVR